MALYNSEVLETTSTMEAEPRSPEAQRRWLRERSGGHCVIVAELLLPDEELEGGVFRPAFAGFASLSQFRERAGYRTTVENSIYVARTARGNGVGRALLGALLERARLHGFHTVIARIADNNDASLRLHSSLGFEVVGVEREVARKFGRWIDMTEMQIIL